MSQLPGTTTNRKQLDPECHTAENNPDIMRTEADADEFAAMVNAEKAKLLIKGAKS
jgi:hypothetical protein